MQSAHTKPEIAIPAFKNSRELLVAHLFYNNLTVAKLEAGAAFGLYIGYAACAIFLSLHFQMSAQLILQVRIAAKMPQAHPERRESTFHGASPRQTKAYRERKAPAAQG